jgi:hypothetical protein
MSCVCGETGDAEHSPREIMFWDGFGRRGSKTLTPNSYYWLRVRMKDSTKGADMRK